MNQETRKQLLKRAQVLKKLELDGDYLSEEDLKECEQVWLDSYEEQSNPIRKLFMRLKTKLNFFVIRKLRYFESKL